MSEHESIEDILPSDGVLHKRRELWQSLMHTYMNENDDEQSIDVKVLDMSDEFETVRSCSESVSSSKFESSNHEDDANFNIKDVLNQTKPIIEKRKQAWKRTGVDQLFDSCFDNSIGKVDQWLKYNCDYFASEFSRDSDKHNIKINEKNIVIERSLHDNSYDSSVDTAKYILSNRNRRKSRVTLTIKKFCYSAQSERNGNRATHYETNYCPRMLTLGKSDERIESDDKRRKSCKLLKTQNYKRRKSHSRRRHKSSSSCSSGSDTSYKPTNSKTENKVRKKLRKTSTQKKITSSSSTDTNDEIDVPFSRKSARIVKNLKKTVDNSDASETNQRFERLDTTRNLSKIKRSIEILPELLKQNKHTNGIINNDSVKEYVRSSPNSKQSACGRSTKENLPSDRENRLENSNSTDNRVVNSTAIRSQDSMIQCKKTFEANCNNLRHSEGIQLKNNLHNSTVNTCISSNSNNNRKTISQPILIYSPSVSQRLTRNTSVNSGKIEITEKHLEKSLGIEMKNQYLGGKKQFNYVCDAASQLLFIPPEKNREVIVTSGSEADPLDMLGCTPNGKIIELVTIGSKRA